MPQGVIATIPKYQFSGATGLPLVNGTLTVYLAGTTTATNTWQDSALTIANTNPVVLDSRGECVLWLDSTVVYKFVLKNALGVTQWTQDNITGALSLGSTQSSLITFVQGGTGAVTRTVQAKIREIEINLLDYGADPTGVSSCNAALSAAKTYFDTFTVTPDSGGPTVRAKFVVPPGTFLLTADAELPIYTECLGRFTGAFKLKLTNVKRPNIKGLSCTTLKLSGCWFGVFEDCYPNALQIDGGGVGFGTFWNTFTRIQGNVAIDLSNWSVNQNTFSGRGGFVTTGSGVNVLDGHANSTINWDFTGGQCSNTASVLQDSILIGSYYEAGSDVVGPFHLFGFQGDSFGPPKVPRRNHILGAFDVVERNSADFIATGDNILAGGAWDFVDTSGKPPCISSSGGTTVAADSTEPFGMGVKYGGSFSAAFTGFAITVPPCKTGKFSLVVAYQGDNFAAVQVDRGGGGGSSTSGDSVVTIDSVNNWKLLRLSGLASQTANTTVTLFALTSAGAKTISIGGMYATQEKAAQYPAPQYIREAHGTVTQGYIVGTNVALAVTFPKAFASPPVVITNIANNGAQTPNYTKIVIENLTVSGFTARVYFTTDWTGILQWFARGVN